MNYKNVGMIIFDAVFPAGVSMGASSNMNLSEIDINGLSEPVIRGTSIAGVLRHRYSEKHGEADARSLFGEAIFKSSGKESRIRAYDTVLDTGKSVKVLERTSNAIDRHWGRVLKGSLYDVQMCPPGTRAFFSLDVYSENTAELEDVVQNISSILIDEIILGGNSNRGIGLMKLEGKIKVAYYDLCDVEEHAEYLNFRRKLKSGNREIPEKFKPVHVYRSKSEDILDIEVDFSIPEGQDILIGDGTLQPQKTIGYDGEEYWLLPGSTLRGNLRSFITGLAARNGENVSYSLDRAPTCVSSDDDTSSNIGWLFNKPSNGEKRKPELHKHYPVASLFGSLHAAGRLHISDSFIPVNGEMQTRMHVSVDAVSGSAIEGMLFSNGVISSEDCQNNSFKTTFRVVEPEERELMWIVSGLKAINSGFLRIGSSKASGRLEVVDAPKANGKLSEVFDKIWKEFS